jgi:preprotein translocase subunit SecE
MPGGTKQPTRGARAPQEQRRRFSLRLPRFMDDTISELKKVTWPTGAETRYLTTVVIIVALAVGAALGLIDIFFNWLVDNLLLR